MPAPQDDKAETSAPLKRRRKRGGADAAEAAAPTATQAVASEVPVTPGFSPWQLKLLGFVAVFASCLLVLYLFNNVSKLETRSARFLICLLVSLLLAIFFFVWWPKAYELDKIPVIQLPVRVAGPVVLWIAIFLLLLEIMPNEDRYLRLVAPVNAPGGAIAYHHEITATYADGRPVAIELVENRDRVGYLSAVLVKFGPGEERIEAQLHVPHCKPLPVTFTRTDSSFDASKLELERK